jgi:hypothetical protein
MNNEEIIKILKRIEERLDNIENILAKTQNSAQKMEDHINFVDEIYDNIKKPFCKILTYYNGEQVIIEKNNLLENNS